MKKYVMVTVCGLLFFTAVGSAQSSAFGTEVSNQDIERKVKTEGGKYVITEDKMDNIDVTGVGGSTFKTANNYDGTGKSMDHSVRISVVLQTNAKAGSNFELVFYSSNEIVPFSAGTAGNTTYIFYPIELYDNIMKKLEQSITARKRIQLKVTQRVTGYREGTLVF